MPLAVTYPIPAPDVVGLDQATAEATLGALQIPFDYAAAVSNILPTGSIVSQSPVAGTLINLNQGITLTPSLGVTGKRFYGINKGGMNPKDVTENSGTNLSDVEVTVDLTKPFMTDKLIVCECLREIKRYVQSVAAIPTTEGTILLNQVIPNLTGTGTRYGSAYGSWPHLCDIYIPAYCSIERAMICLHGATGTRNSFAQNFAITTTNPATIDTTDWALLRASKAMWIFPQGQFCDGFDSPTNPGGAISSSSTTTWGNGYMNSGWQDLKAPDWTSGQNAAGFIYDLVQYLKDRFPVNKFALLGHSNGAFMVERWYYQGSDIFAHYISTSGTKGYRLRINSTAVDATNKARPFFSQYGLQDTTIGIANQARTSSLDAVNAPWYNFFGETTANWLRPTAVISVEDESYPSPAPDHLPGWNNYQDKVAATSAESTLKADLTGSFVPVASGNLHTLSRNGGKLVLRLLSAAGHSTVSQQNCLGVTSLVDTFMQFIWANP